MTTARMSEASQGSLSQLRRRRSATPWKSPAVEDPGVVALDQELAAGDRPDTAEESQQRRAGGGADRDMAAALLSGTGAGYLPSHPPRRDGEAPPGPLGGRRGRPAHAGREYAATAWG